MTAVATAAGAAFALGRLISRREIVAARREASTDALTGLANRTHLMRELNKRAKHQIPYTLAMIDLNGFKPVNDTYGHAAGDILLQRLAAHLRSDLAPSLVVRLGGDEFAVLADPYAARYLAGAITTSVRRPVTVTDCAHATSIELGAGVGLARVAGNSTPSQALKAADVAMYRSKLTGRAEFETLQPRQDAPVVHTR